VSRVSGELQPRGGLLFLWAGFVRAVLTFLQVAEPLLVHVKTDHPAIQGVLHCPDIREGFIEHVLSATRGPLQLLQRCLRGILLVALGNPVNRSGGLGLWRQALAALLAAVWRQAGAANNQICYETALNSCSRKRATVLGRPTAKGIRGLQPRASSRLTSSCFFGVPSGLVLSQSIAPW